MALLSEARRQAFSLIELLVVIVLILILTGLLIGAASYAQRASAENRARAEIRALELALQSYKMDNGMYPCHCVCPTLHCTCRWFENLFQRRASRYAEQPFLPDAFS